MNVVLAAGTVNGPRILQLSGIGPAKLMDSLDLERVVDALGVDKNFQDFLSFYIGYESKSLSLETVTLWKSLFNTVLVKPWKLTPHIIS